MRSPAGASAYVTKQFPSCSRARCDVTYKAFRSGMDSGMDYEVSYTHVMVVITWHNWCDKQSHDASQDEDASATK